MKIPILARRARVFVLSLWVLVGLALSACDWSAELGVGDNDDDELDNATPAVNDTDIAGLSLVVSSSDFDTTRNDLDTAIAAQGRYQTQFINHQANADSVDLGLRPTSFVVFDDPNRSAALIAADARVALDLPARLLVYRNGDAETAVAWNNADYLDARYDLDDAEDGALDGLDDDARTLAENGAGNTVDVDGSAGGLTQGQGIERVEAGDDFTTTVNRLIDAIAARDNLVLVNTIDNRQRANNFGRSLNPSVLLIFGNPEVGTRLMQSSQTAGIDLPQKMLVSQDDNGDVTIYYNDPGYIAARHGIDDDDDRIEAIADLLATLADEAVGNGATEDQGTGPSIDTDTSPNDGGGVGIATGNGAGVSNF